MAPRFVVRIIVTVGHLPTRTGKNLMPAANKIRKSAIYHLCSTVDQVVPSVKTLHPALPAPIKDRP
jgi:hypothetical protein